MGPVRILILCIALAAGIGAAVMLRGMSKAQPPKVVVAAAPVVVEKPTSQVLVAKRDLPAGTNLVAADMTWQAWPKESLNPAFIVQASSPKPEGDIAKAEVAAQGLAQKVAGTPDPAVAALLGAMVREPILANEPMTDRKVVRAGTAGVMAVSLTTGMRAMSVPLSAESAAGGFILPGDHVDVVVSRALAGAAQDGAKHVLATTVMKNVKVLAIDQNRNAPKDGTSVVGATATLELDPQQAEVLIQAKGQGELTLVLRSYADIAGPAVTVAQNVRQADGVFRASVVRVFKSGQPSEVTVNQ